MVIASVLGSFIAVLIKSRLTALMPIAASTATASAFLS
jgi:hypothetical protein